MKHQQPLTAAGIARRCHDSPSLWVWASRQSKPAAARLAADLIELGCEASAHTEDGVHYVKARKQR